MRGPDLSSTTRIVPLFYEWSRGGVGCDGYHVACDYNICSSLTNADLIAMPIERIGGVFVLECELANILVKIFSGKITSPLKLGSRSRSRSHNDALDLSVRLYPDSVPASHYGIAGGIGGGQQLISESEIRIAAE